MPEGILESNNMRGPWTPVFRLFRGFIMRRSCCVMPASAIVVLAALSALTAQTADAPAAPQFDGLLTGTKRHAELMRFWPAGLNFIKRQGLILFDEGSMPRLYQITDEGWRILRADDNTSANNEDPWFMPGGVRPGSIKKFGFIQLSKDNPMLWWHGQKADGTFDGIHWRYGRDTRVGELLVVTDERGSDHTVMVRTRRKCSLQSNDWSVQEYSPTGTLDAAFMPMRGADRDGRLVPRGFQPLDIDNQTCSRCHRDAGTVVREGGERRWRLRGDDGIFSFHPFDAADPRKLNARLVEAGLLVKAVNLP
jgi:hypothetical protein